MNVVVVDDDHLLLRSAARWLKREGFAVTEILVTTQSLKEVQEQIASQAFEAIVSDMMMPGFTGVDLVAALREAGVKTPVVICSGGIPIASVREKLNTMLASGDVAFFLPKPYNPDELTVVLKKAIGE